MKRLTKQLQQIIKKKRFTFNSLENGDRAVDITLRIQTIGTIEEGWYTEETPINHNRWSKIYVNVVVSGTASTKANWRAGESCQKPIEEVATVSRNNYYRQDAAWGYEHHKKIREHIRNLSQKEIAEYLKLFGICDGIPRYGPREIQIKKISWGKV
jgi:hypothetical protein